MLDLPNVSIVCITNKDFEGHKMALDKSCEKINFGSAKIIWDEKCNSIDEWNKKIIYDLPKYVDTDFCFLFHGDGYIIHPELWRDEWLAYDYIGAPWPLPRDNYSYRDEAGEIVRVGNSVSLRSKKLMDLVATREWKSYHGNTNEDGFICCHNRKWLESQGCKFAPIEIAKYFSREHEVEENKDVIHTFAFHSVDL